MGSDSCGGAAAAPKLPPERFEKPPAEYRRYGLLLRNPQVAAPEPRRRFWLPWAAAAGMAAVAVTLSVVHFREPHPAVSGPVRFQILLPEKKRFAGYLALSPDGRKAAFAALDNSGNGGQLWVRSLGTLDSRLVARYGSGASAFPFWSPDSRYLAWFNDGRLKKMDVSGGAYRGHLRRHRRRLGWILEPERRHPVRKRSRRSVPGSSYGRCRHAIDIARYFPAGNGPSLPIVSAGWPAFIYLRSTADGRGALYAGSLDDPPGKTPKKVIESHLYYTLYSPGCQVLSPTGDIFFSSRMEL